MRYDIYFIFNYWKIHWRQAVIILMSYVLLVVFVFTTYSMVRTEFRRVYFDNFNFMEPNDLGSTGLQGGYNNIFSGLSEETADALAAEGCVESSGKVYTDAYLGNGSSYYTYGAYIGDTACELSGIAMRSGRFPQMPGEAAISELAMSNMGIDAGVGDTVMLTEFDEDGDAGGVREFMLSGIFKDKATRMNW